MPAAVDRMPRFLLVCAFAFSAAAASIAWRELPAAMACFLAGSWSLMVGTGWWMLHRARTRARELAARIEGAALTQKRFANRFAHEMKTPLTILVNRAELVHRCCDDPAAVRVQARSIVDYLLHFSGLLDGFLRLGNPAAPADTGQHVPIHFHDLLVRAVQHTGSMTSADDVRIVTSLAESGGDDDPPEVVGQAALLEAMVESLVLEAVRVSPRGCVSLRVTTMDHTILLAVRQHGAVIRGSHLASVFDWRFDAQGADGQSQGPVVGLAIASLIAEHHGGTITLHDHAEGGCEFTLTLPRWQAQRPGPATTPGSGKSTEPDPHRSRGVTAEGRTR